LRRIDTINHFGSFDYGVLEYNRLSLIEAQL